MQKLIVTAEVRRLNCQHIYRGETMAWNPYTLYVFLADAKRGCRLCDAPYGLELDLRAEADARLSINTAFAESRLTITKLEIEHIGKNGKPILSLF